MADVEMNKGVQILLERMSSNPDEFIPTLRDGYPAKWRDILVSVEMRTNGGKDYKDQLSFLNDKEIKALWEKMQSLQGELFTNRVMDTLLRDAHDFERLETMKQLPLLLEELEKHSPAELSSLSRQVTGGRLKKIK
jgi:hypothetical protein